MSKSPKAKEPKILFYDIETSPNLGYIWGKYEQNVLDYKHEWELLSFAYKWKGDKTVKCLTRQDFKNDTTDKSLLQELWQLLNDADIVIAHNGDQFDNKKANARFISAGMIPPAPYQSIDTKKVAKANFMFNSNKLDDLGKLLGVGRKVKHTGFDLWLGCLAGEKKSWATMAKYNKQDVALLERVYNKLLPWINNHPNVAQLTGHGQGCPKCGSTKLKSCGLRYTKASTYRRYRCLDCQGFCRGAKALPPTATRRKPKIVNL